MTTYYFIRHAEKEKNGTRNPNLTAKGKKRAHHWAEVLKDKAIDMIFCSELKRTQQTARPLAEILNLEIQIYDTANLYSRRFQNITQGKTVLIVGHQDTTPNFINRILKERRFTYIEHNNHGNLYKVIIEQNGQMEATLRQVDF